MGLPAGQNDRYHDPFGKCGKGVHQKTKVEYLKEIFDLMYKKLSELAIGDGFSERMEDREKITFNKVRGKGDDYLFEKLALTIFSGGFKAQIVDAKWPFIKKAFDDFDIQKVAGYSQEKVAQLLNNPNIIRHSRKVKAIVTNARKIIAFQEKHGSFANYLESIENPLVLVQDPKKKLDFLGRETVWDFLKEIGYEAIKPDVHVRRILFRLGLISSEKSSPRMTEEVFEVAREISKATNKRLGVIDGLLWFYGANKPQEIRKAICGKRPLCSECYLTKYCKHFNKEHGIESAQQLEFSARTPFLSC